MPRRSGSNKTVEEKRRCLPIYQHFSLSPGKTKSHHPEAKCNHCLKEFVCGSKQRLIRHLRKCNSISNSDQIIAETLNTLASFSATGQLNHSILEASNLLPSQVSALHRPSTNNNNSASITQHHITPQAQHYQQPQEPPTSITTASSNISVNNNGTSNNQRTDSNILVSTDETCGSGLNDPSVVLLQSSSNGTLSSITTPIQRGQKRGRKPANQQGTSNNSSGIHVTTGSDGKAHFTPASQLNNVPLTGAPPSIITPSRGRRVGYNHAITPNAASNNLNVLPGSGNLNSNHLGASATSTITSSTPTHHHSPVFKLNSEPIDKAYLKLVLTRNLPLSLCDTKEFQAWLKTFGSNEYKPPTSINLITQNLASEAQAARQKIHNILVKSAKKSISLELHCWNDDHYKGHSWFAMFAITDQKRFLVSVKDICYNNLSMRYISSNDNSTNAREVSNILATTTKNTNFDSISSDAQRDQQLMANGDSNFGRKLLEFIDDCVKRLGSDRINSFAIPGSNQRDYFANRARYFIQENHPSIIISNCWWYFTNILCSDVIESNKSFQEVVRNSKKLIDLLHKGPLRGTNLQKFRPFCSAVNHSGRAYDQRWHCHLVGYLLSYVKNNRDSILETLEAWSSSQFQEGDQHQQSYLTLMTDAASDTNNNSSGTNNHIGSIHPVSNNGVPGTHGRSSTTSPCHEDQELNEIKTTIKSPEFWATVDSILGHIQPIRDLVALTSSIPSQHQTSQQAITESSTSPLQEASSARANRTTPNVLAPQISPIMATNFSLGDYASWLINYAKTLFDSYNQSPDMTKYQLIGRFLSRFSESIVKFKLLFAAYLLNPKHKGAFMTQKAKKVAIEEILNIASEFLTDESDGVTIFDQWKLYLVREEPYDVVYDQRHTPSEWWLSLPCAESIRRVALRILRLKAFTIPKPEKVFHQLHLYQDETDTNLNSTCYEDLIILRMFYDYEDKIGLNHPPFSHICNTVNSSSNDGSVQSNGSGQANLYPSVATNGYRDRTEVGLMHNSSTDSFNKKPLPNDCFEACLDPSRAHETTIGDEQQSLSSSFSDIVIEQYQAELNMDAQAAASINSGGDISSLSLEELTGYELFSDYIDFKETGVVVLEEPVKKKARKWTAQEILSKCESNNQALNTKSSSNAASK